MHQVSQGVNQAKQVVSPADQVYQRVSSAKEGVSPADQVMCVGEDNADKLEHECMSEGYLSSESEYVPDKEYHRCGVENCAEDIVLGCNSCAALLCFDHMDTDCAEHIRHSLVLEISTSDSPDIDESLQPTKGNK